LIILQICTLHKKYYTIGSGQDKLAGFIEKTGFESCKK
jgi:hypothetical protein